MKRFIVLLVGIISMLGLTPVPAQAHHDGYNFFSAIEGTTWNSSLHKVWLTTEWSNQLTTTQYNNARDSVMEADDEWASISGPAANPVVLQSGTTGNWPAYQELSAAGTRTQACNTLPFDHPKNSIHWEPYASTAGTLTCDSDNNGTIDWFVMIVSSYTQDFMHFNGYTDPATDEIDLRGVLTHEWGHVQGFDSDASPVLDGHFDDSWNECDHNGSTWHTMCKTGWGTEGGRVAARTLENHEVGEYLDHY